MYGTIARFHVKPGMREQMIQLMRQENSRTINGWIVDYVFQVGTDSEEFFLVAIFKDKVSYDTNANSPEQNESYLKWRAMLVSDPEWHDGEIVSAAGPGSKQ